MSVRQISAHEATVKTATVEVKSLTISGKQVTLAVFRQLIDEPVIDDLDDETGLPSLAGQPWGTVNYHPDKCSGEARHLHVVWQRAAQLRRSTVRFSLPEWSSNWEEQVADIRYLAVLRKIVEADGEGEVFAPIPRYRFGVRSGDLAVTYRDATRHEDAQRFLRSFKSPRYEGAQYRESRQGQWYDDPERLRQDIGAGAARLAGSRAAGLDAAATWEYANREQGDLGAARAKYHALYGELEALDQLFIAV